jgi:hypothetical protein
MNLNESLITFDDDLEFDNLNNEPLNMSDDELKSKTAELYGCPVNMLDFSKDKLKELYDLKNNYRSVSIDQAISALCR